MKKVFAIILCLFMLINSVAYADISSGVEGKEYELWTQSPSVTCGLTSDDIRIYKALEQNKLKLMSLSSVGENYYLAICENKITNGGYNANQKTTEYYFYTLYSTDTGFIVLSYQNAINEYYWDNGFCISDITKNIDSEHYEKNDSEVPIYILNPKGKYISSNWTEYDEYYIITNTGKLYKMTENAENGAEGYPFIKDSILYRGQNRYKKSSSSYYSYYLMDDGSTQASNSTPIWFKNGTMSYDTAVKFPTSEMTTTNGYILYKEGFSSNVTIPSYYSISGSNNLFYTYDTVRTQDPLNSSYYYYYLNITIYKSENGNMKNMGSTVVPTKSTSTNFSSMNINDLDENYYISKGMPVPSVVFDDYAVITQDGTVYSLNLDSSIYNNNYTCFCTYNGHLALIRSYNGTQTIYKQDAVSGNYGYWQVINEITFDASGEMVIGEDLELTIQSSPHDGQNGYFSNYNTFNSSNFTLSEIENVKSWWGRTLSNVFPDGRYATARWMGHGSGIYEIWYDIYNSDGTLRSTGPTGYSAYFGSVVDAYETIVWAINDSKFIVCYKQLNNTFLKEYYRISIATETNDGEIISKVELGEKTIIPPNTSDTEVVQNKIDFGSQELPLGYNIKDNVIDSSKLDAFLREQVNSIRLNDIVVLVKEGYQSGEQNTGVTLNSYSDYDYSFGYTQMVSISDGIVIIPRN